ncbi:MAG: hypothetical protein SXA11_19715 [Cyanobacteriota bacterium]|nr:hypothetical protein [Cyanobacteriota bacterium]
MVFRERVPNLSIADKFLSLDNFIQAFCKVAAKKGSPGVDGESIEEFRKKLRENVSRLRDEVANNKYQPLPCKRASMRGRGEGETRRHGEEEIKRSSSPLSPRAFPWNRVLS